MNELVFIQNDEILVSSKDIANNFSKQHGHVLRYWEYRKRCIQFWRDVPQRRI